MQKVSKYGSKEQIQYVKNYLKSYSRKKHILNCLRHEKNRRERQTGSERYFGLSAPLSQSPYQNIPDGTLNENILFLEEDLTMAENIVDGSEFAGLLRDLYINRLTWVKISLKWHIDEATISRNSRKGLMELYFQLT